MRPIQDYCRESRKTGIAFAQKKRQWLSFFRQLAKNDYWAGRPVRNGECLKKRHLAKEDCISGSCKCHTWFLHTLFHRESGKPKSLKVGVFY